MMPDPLLFALGLLVTAVASMAVWTIGKMEDEEREARRPAETRAAGGETRR